MTDCKKIANFLFYAFFFLLPIFYVPKIGTSYILSQKLLVIVFTVAVFVLFAAWIVQQKKVVVKKSRIIAFLGIFLLLSTASLLLSNNILQGFLGRSNSIDSYFMIAIYSLLAFFTCNFISEKETLFNIFKSFILGSALLAAGFLASVIFKFKTDFFVPIESFSLIFALGLSCFLVLSFYGSEMFFKRGKIVAFAIISILFTTSLLIINYKLAWFFILIVSFLVFWKRAAENNFLLKNPRVILPLVIAVVSFGLFFAPKLINYDFQLGYEQSLSYSSGTNIAQKTLSEPFKNILLGSGPATYIYNYSLYKGKELGDSTLVFNQGPVALLTLAGSLGVLAIIFLLLAWLIFVMKGFKFLQNEGTDKEQDLISSARSMLFPIGFALLAIMFLYKMTIVPMVFSFFVLGAWANLGVIREIEFKFKGKYFILEIILFIAALFLFVGAFIFAKQYYAESFYQRGVRDYVDQNDLDYALQNGLKAIAAFNAGDYYIGVSQLYILKASDIFNSNEKVVKQKTAATSDARNIAAQAESLAKMATKSDPLNYNAWYNLGLIYENTSFLVENKNKDALLAYEQARQLAPYNYDIYFSKGRVYEKQGDNADAIISYEEALQLNPNIDGLAEKIQSLKKLLK
ncbi:MAG: tetratricopeptide repeat protein [Candidatus Paceibacterota bacterium]